MSAGFQLPHYGAVMEGSAAGYPGGFPPVPGFQQGYDTKNQPPVENLPPIGQMNVGSVSFPAQAEPPDAAPSAPPFEIGEQISGYEGAGLAPTSFAPPSYEEVIREPTERGVARPMPAVTEQEARQALLEHVAQHCCYGKGAAEELVFRDLRSSSAFHYTLETFTESRSCAWTYEPFTGQMIDGPHCGRAPSAWEIMASPSFMFVNSEHVVEVPHTASVKACGRCRQTGRVRCSHCFGSGTVMCFVCGGSGRVQTTHHDNNNHHHHHQTTCHACFGRGRNSCISCSGSGQVTCTICRGYCRLKCYVALTITWKVHLKDYIVERTAMPDHLIREAQGGTAFEEEQPRVWPINHFPDQSINSASKAIVDEHANGFPLEKILMQRHKVRVVPVTEAFSTWKNKDVGIFYVYGLENRVHAPDYPQQCCCGCSVL